jgi:CO dehydrogenase maturation factor
VAAERITAFRHELDIHIANSYIILNRTPQELPLALQERIGQMDVPLLGLVPANDELVAFEYTGRPLIELPDDSPVYTAVAEMMRHIL